MKTCNAIVIILAATVLSVNGFSEGTNQMNDRKVSVGTEMNLMAPVWVIGSYDKAGKANMMTAAWGGICCSKPPCVTISLRKATYTYGNIMERKAYTVNIPSKAHIKAADYFGLVSGADVDKLATTGLTPIKGDHVDAPYLKEFPVAIECKLVKTVELGLHTMFIGEIMDVKADNTASDQSPDMLIFDPKNHDYHAVGESLGKAFSIGRELTTNQTNRVK